MYWNGFDFGPNLSYAEECKCQSDPGEYMNPAEAAELTFDDVKNNGYIPGYSDDVEYTMTLVDIADIDGKECYVYRCDTESGDFSAGFAFPYQSDGIYRIRVMGIAPQQQQTRRPRRIMPAGLAILAS
jgi:hypothetical protein